MLADSLTDLIIHPPPAVLFVVGIGLFAWTVMQLRRKKLTTAASKIRSTQVGQTKVNRETNGISPAEIRTMAQELHALLSELHETSRRIAAQVDNRTSKLDALIVEADEKIKRLEQLQANGPAMRVEVTDGLGGRRPAAGAMAEDPKYRRIYELADRGHSPREIAQQVGSPQGEVELILNLRARPAGR